jgi:bifunctional DNA-binding transcriptional regulator/antitoxin component of YhaV-PrlF toxin-antitoxin module
VLTEGDEEIVKRTAGAAEFAAREGGCGKPPEIGGAAAGALKKTSDKRLEARLHGASEAHYLTVRDAAKLGKPNVPIATKLGDAIAEASYLAHIALPSLAALRERLHGERSSVLRTLEKQVDEEKARAGPDKKGSEERLRRLEAARESLARMLEAQIGEDVRAVYWRNELAFFRERGLFYAGAALGVLPFAPLELGHALVPAERRAVLRGRRVDAVEVGVVADLVLLERVDDVRAAAALEGPRLLVHDDTRLMSVSGRAVYKDAIHFRVGRVRGVY